MPQVSTFANGAGRWKSRELSMATCPEITKKYARQYVKAGKAEKWRL